MQKKLNLYQMAISHYCEKVRWALDFKKIPYKVHNLLPGPHISVIRKLIQNRSSSVPVIQHKNQVFYNSLDILDYLEVQFPEPALSPSKFDQASIREWEAFADSNIGPHVRRCCYHVLLNHKAIVVPMLAQGGPWYGSFLLRAIYPRLVKVMRRSMQIDQQGYDQSKLVLDQAIERLRNHLVDRQFLVGDEFTRADLVVAALLAPLSRAPGYGIDWPTDLPAELDTLAAEYADVLAWVNRIYRDYRQVS